MSTETGMIEVVTARARTDKGFRDAAAAWLSAHEGVASYLGITNESVEATRALVELFLDGTLDLTHMPRLQVIGEAKVRAAIERTDIADKLRDHLNHTNGGNNAANNLAWWFCGWGLEFRSLDIEEPTLLRRPLGQ